MVRPDLVLGTPASLSSERHRDRGRRLTRLDDSRRTQRPGRSHCDSPGGQPRGATLSECLERDLLDRPVADTGDDVEVSERVAELIVRVYELPDPDTGPPVLAPSGEILFFGGDTAYPVATSEEINNRVMVPFNRVLSRSVDGRPRVLLGIPGNHDWYDGLDGFARMFRRRPNQDDDEAPPSVVNIEQHAIEK